MRNRPSKLALNMLVVLLGAVGTTAFAADAPNQPDNTGINKRDSTNAAPVADQQPNDRALLETTKRIRSSLTDDKSLSTYAHNVKVITEHGEVILRGPVRSSTERQRVVDLAKQAAGSVPVKNELELAPQ